jgi:endoglucanase
MRRISASFAFLLAFSLCGAANFTSTHGKLSVSGRKILNKNTQEVVLRGMSMYWYNGPWQGGQPGNQFYTSAVVSSLANDWGASVVRAAIGDKSVSMAKSMMDWANSAGIYVIIDNHSHNAHNETSAVQNFFRDVSAYAKEKGYTHVIYEIYNEPVCSNGSNDAANCTKTTWTQIKTFAQSVISTIRTNDPDGLIIVGTPGYSSSISSARADPLTGTYAKNVLYALHFYAGSNSHNSYKNSLKTAYCNDFPVFVTEWGTSASDGGGTINTSNSNDWISLLEAAKVSHANWSLSNTNESSAALNGTNINNNLTTSGAYVKNLMKLNGTANITGICAPNASTQCLTQQTINCSTLEPNEPSGPNGRIQFGFAETMANFASKNGADSSESSPWGLVNTSSSFTANYTLIEIPKPGFYTIWFRIAATANGTVSWSGSGIAGGQAPIQSTGSLSTYQYTDKYLLTISEAPETSLRLSFEMPSANSLKAVSVITTVADSLDSIKLAIPTSVKRLTEYGKNWNYNSVSRTFAFEADEGILAVYNLRGERKAVYAATGSVSLKELPSGTYLAVYRRGFETSRKTIFLK